MPLVSRLTPLPNMDRSHDLDTEFLVIGCGPAGASLSCFLTSYGM